MKVYILHGCIDHDWSISSDLLGVFDTLEKAKSHVKSLKETELIWEDDFVMRLNNLRQVSTKQGLEFPSPEGFNFLSITEAEVQ
jgi:molecular chaperone GrpE (heat shock protein)